MTYFGTIDESHLVIGKFDGFERLIVLDYQSDLNKIENFTLSDGNFLLDELISIISISPNNLGNVSWENAGNLGLLSQVTNVIDAQILFFQSQETEDGITDYLNRDINPSTFSSPTYIILDDDNDGIIEVGETLSIEIDANDVNGISDVSVNWYSIEDDVSTFHGMSKTYEVKESDAGNKIEFEAVAIDLLGNYTQDIIYEIDIPVSELYPTIFNIPKYEITNDDGDSIIEVSEILFIDSIAIDQDGISVKSVDWYSFENGVSTYLGTGENYQVKEGDAGNQIQYQVVVTDNLGNYNQDIIYEIEIPQSELYPTTFNVPIYEILNDDGDGVIEVSEALSINSSQTDEDGIAEVSVDWYSIREGVSTYLGMSETYEVKEGDAGNEIQFQVVAIDNLGNYTKDLIYEIQIAETESIPRFPSTEILTAQYPDDMDIQKVLFEPDMQYKWGNEIGTAPTLTFSFAKSDTFELTEEYSLELGFDYNLFEQLLTTSELNTFNTIEINFIKETLDNFSDASGITFREVEETTSSFGEIRFFSMDFDNWKILDNIFEEAGAFAYTSWPTGILPGDIFLNSNDKLGMNDLQDGYFETTINHEIGHVLGLSHTFEGYLPDKETTLNFDSLMTYDHSSYYLPDSPMAYDIKALEFLYGGTDEANTIDNFYGWDINHFTRSSIIDDGGNDTYNFHNQFNGVFVNLKPDTWSSISDNINLANDNLIHDKGQIYTSSGTSIENVITTGWSDNVYDNALVDNIVRLGADDDEFHYFGGFDEVYGDQGEDYVFLEFLSSDFYATANLEENNYFIFNHLDKSSNPTKVMMIDDVEYIQFTDGVKTPNELILNKMPNTTPISITLDQVTLDKILSGVHIANINGIDPENDELTYTIVEGIGDDSMFMVMGNKMLHIANNISVDYETDNQLEVTLRATDPYELYVDQLFIIDIIDDIYETDTSTFTASIDKWQSDGNGGGMDGPSMKLHHKDEDGIADGVGIDLLAKSDGEAGHKHKPDIDKGNYELRVEHNQDTDGAIDIEDVMSVLSLSRGLSSVNSKEHELAADWNGDGLIDIEDVMSVLSRSRGLSKDDEWRFHDKASNTSLWDNDSKTNKLDITLDGDDQIDLTAILRGDVNGSYNAAQHNRATAPEANYAPLPVNNDDDLLMLQVDIV